MAKFYSKEEDDFLIKNAPIYGAQICADKLNRSVYGVRSRLSRLKVKSNKDKFITEGDVSNLKFVSTFKELNIDFSSSKTPKELAYWLGYFWADGYNRKDNYLIIEITREDGDNIQNIFMNLADFSIYTRKRDGRKEQISFAYRDKNISEFLKSLGKYPNSLESHKKILEYIPDNYLIYFLRGLIDGDGCWYLHKNILQFSIVAAYNFNWSNLQEKLNSIGLKTNVSNRASKHGNSSIIRATDSKNIKEFIKKLYKVNDGIWLNRKYNKIKEIIYEQAIKS